MDREAASNPPRPPSGDPHGDRPGGPGAETQGRPEGAASRRPPKPWEPQEGEGAEAFQAASCYLEMGAGRSLAKVGQKCGKSVSLMERWSEQWRWVERAQAYDRRMARVAQRAREQALEKETEEWAQRRSAIREREWRIAETMQELGEKILDEEVKYGSNYKLGDAITLLRRASELARLAAEMPARPAAASATRPGAHAPGDSSHGKVTKNSE